MRLHSASHSSMLCEVMITVCPAHIRYITQTPHICSMCHRAAALRLAVICAVVQRTCYVCPAYHDMHSHAKMPRH